MRFMKTALVCAAGVAFSSGFAAGPVLAERIWTDDIPVGRAYVKPPLPSRPSSGEQRVAALGEAQVPSLAPLTVAPLRIALLHEITRLKSQAKNPRQIESLDALGALYGGEIAGPFWVDGDRFKPQVAKLIAEMRRADEYALDPADFQIPDTDFASNTQSAALGELGMSLAVMTYARDAFGANFEPNDISLWLDNKPEVPAAADLLPRLANSKDPAQVLKSLHPQSAQFEKLRQAYLVVTGRMQPKPVAMPAKIPDGPTLKVGDSDPQVAMVRKRLDVPAKGVAATYFDRALGNEIRNYLRRNGKSRKREINDTLRALLNAPPKPPKMPELETIKANMLRWRWLPHDLGSTYVWNNIPEYMTRVFKNGKVIHEERIIVGKPSQQTPVFSDTMDHIVFKPQWGVPNSIKITDLLPRLRGGDYSVLSRRSMKIVKDGRTINPGSIRWSKTDIRYLSIVQSPSAWNPLGQMKFMFPNKHSVYMHDTNNRGLFSSKQRAFSHGCIRVRHPHRLAEVLFRDVQGWDPEEIDAHLGKRAEENNEMEFTKQIPVHNVYFTLVADKNGQINELPDIYGHDRRIAKAMAGKSLQWLASNDPARIHQKRVQELERSTRYIKSSSSSSSRRSRAEDEYADYYSGLGAPRRGLSAREMRRLERRNRRASRRIKPAWPPDFFPD